MEGRVMGKGGRGKPWTAEMDEVLKERFANEKNGDLAKEYGYAARTIRRHAELLGLSKSAELMERIWREGVAGSVRKAEYMRITGQKVKRKRIGGAPWQKGHRFEGEIEEKRVAALRARSEDERKRIIRGWTRKTKWPMVDYATGEKV